MDVRKVVLLLFLHFLEFQVILLCLLQLLEQGSKHLHHFFTDQFEVVLVHILGQDAQAVHGAHLQLALESLYLVDDSSQVVALQILHVLVQTLHDQPHRLVHLNHSQLQHFLGQVHPLFEVLEAPGVALLDDGRCHLERLGLDSFFVDVVKHLNQGETELEVTLARSFGHTFAEGSDLGKLAVIWNIIVHRF